MPSSKVQVWIYRRVPRLKFLIFQTSPERGGFWQPVTGHLEEGEDAPKGALRESIEETGLRFVGGPVAVDYRFEFRDRHSGKQVAEEAFLLEAEAESTPGGIGVDRIRLDPKEHVAFRWVDADEALRAVKFESNQEALRQGLIRLRRKDEPQP